jgi:hypothetical protein
MADGGSKPLLAALQRTLERRVAAVGLRQIARDLELHPSTLQNLLRGGSPRSSTRQRLLRWYFGQVREGHTDLNRELAAEAAAALLAAIPAELQGEAHEELLRQVRKIYAERRLSLPSWLVEPAT